MSNEKRPDPTDALPNAVKASASSLKLLKECNRKWYFEKVMGLKPPVKSQAALNRGSELHKIVEAYLEGKTDEIDDPLAVLHQAVLDARRAEQNLKVEDYFKIERGGITLRGFIDLHTARGIWDHKTSSDLKRYGETVETLPQNLQLNLYAHHWFSLYPDAPTCTVGHIQYQTKGKPKVALVEATLTREQVERYMVEVVDPLLALQKEVAKLPGAEYVEPERTSCWNYGGCPFRDKECKPYTYKEIVKMSEIKKPRVLLYLSCRPLNSPIQQIEDLIAQVAPVASAPHPELVQYGKGAAEFAELIVDELIKDTTGAQVRIYARADDKTARSLVVEMKQRKDEIELLDVIEGMR